MPVGTIIPYSTPGVNTTPPIKKLYQPPKILQSTAPKAYEVTLSTEAKVKAMQLEGDTVSMISAQMGLDAKTIDQYLSIAVPVNNPAVKTTYTPPKSTYTPPKPINTAAVPLPTYTAPKSTYAAPKQLYTEPPALTQATTQLTSELTQLPTTQYAAAQLIKTATAAAAVTIKSV